MPAEIYAIIAAVIVLAVIVFLAVRSESKSLGLSGKRNLTSVGGEGWSAEMGWRYVRYIEGETSVNLQIEPMAKDDDIVYVPDEATWQKDAPYSARHKREEILERLKSVEWNRQLEWRDGESSFGIDAVVPGSLESTPGGRMVERRRVFHPGGELTREEAREVWHNAARIFAQSVKGEVKIIMDKGIPGSVFLEIELPVLELNPNVTLNFIKPE